MPFYSYICVSCGHEVTEEHKRGEVPKTIDCSECAEQMDRNLDPGALEMERDFSTLPSETEKLRKNINATNDKISATGDDKVADGIKKWRLELNGGAY